MDLAIVIPLIVVFLLLKGFFSGSEIAMVNSDKLKSHFEDNPTDLDALKHDIVANFDVLLKIKLYIMQGEAVRYIQVNNTYNASFLFFCNELMTEIELNGFCSSFYFHIRHKLKFKANG